MRWFLIIASFISMLWLFSVVFAIFIWFAPVKKQLRPFYIMTRMLFIFKLSRWGNQKYMKAKVSKDNWQSALRKEVRTLILKYTIVSIIFIIFGLLTLIWGNSGAFLILVFLLTPLTILIVFYLSLIYKLLKKPELCSII